MASEQGDRPALPADIEEWLVDHTAETGDDRAQVLARAVTSYRVLSEQNEGDETLTATLTDIESRLADLEAKTAAGQAEDLEIGRVDELESELDSHVEDLRSRIVEVAKDVRARARTDHSHETLDNRLNKIEAETESLRATLDSQQSTTDDLAAQTTELESTTAENEAGLEATSESVETLESKADRLASVVVDLRRRLTRVESHISHQQALARLLATAAKKEITRATCGECGESVELGMLVEPACPHCRNVFNDIESGNWFFNSAVLIVADRPALEAGETTNRPFSATQDKNTSDSHTSNQ